MKIFSQMPIPIRRHIIGFTLIEVLLVISIISALTILCLSFAKQHMQESKVEKAAVQMQQIMQAATTYYIDHGSWPTSGDSEFKNKYIPSGETKDPWGNDYGWCPANAYGKCLSNINSGLFQVTATPNDSFIAMRIKAKLPNAAISADTKGKFVYAQIASPFQTYTAGVYVAQVGQIQALDATKASEIKKTISNFKCPIGYISKIYFNLKFMLNNSSVKPSIKYQDHLLYLFSSPIINIDDYGGCTGKATKCAPYNITVSVDKTGEYCSGEAHFSHLPPVPEGEVIYHCKKSNFYRQYSLGYTIYCCKLDADGNNKSNYCTEQ